MKQLFLLIVGVILTLNASASDHPSSLIKGSGKKRIVHHNKTARKAMRRRNTQCNLRTIMLHRDPYHKFANTSH